MLNSYQFNSFQFNAELTNGGDIKKMNFHNVINNFASTLSTAIASTTQLTMTLTATPTIATPYYLTIGTDPLNSPSACEIVEVTANDAGTLTITRGQQGTTPQTFVNGTQAQILATAGHFTELQSGILVLSGTSELKEKTNKLDFDIHILDITNKKATYHRLNVVDDFGADNTGINDSTTALQAARDYIASQEQPPRLIFPSGIYKYSVSPNWAIQDAQIIADGEVRLRYTGVGNAVIIDSGAYPASGITNLKFGNFIIECPSTAQNALYIRALHHSEISAKILGSGAGYDAIRTEFTVCNKYNITVSNNEGGWYLNSKPQNGIHCTKRNTNELTAYCTFINPILEGLVNGAYLEDAIGSTFIGGTMEGCTSVGCQLSINALQNKFFNVDFESNTASDINCNGHDNQFYGCDSASLMILELNSYNNVVVGGNYSKINIASGAVANTVSFVRYNSVNDSSTISDLGSKTRLSNNYNVGLTRQENTIPTRTVMTVGASPYTYTNTSGNTEKILVTSGTVSNITYAKAGIGDTSPVTSGYFILEPTDFLVITYSVAPSIIKYSM